LLNVLGDDLAPDWFVFFSWPDHKVPDGTRHATTWRSAWRSLTRAISCPKCGELQQPGRECLNEKCKTDIHKVRSPLHGLRFHDLRHQAITELSEGQASDETIMAIAGHVDRRMMSHYSHIRRRARRAAVDRLCGDTAAEDTAQSNSTIAPKEGMPPFQSYRKEWRGRRDSNPRPLP
jgi:ribosomal protein L32